MAKLTVIEAAQDRTKEITDQQDAISAVAPA